MPGKKVCPAAIQAKGRGAEPAGVPKDTLVVTSPQAWISYNVDLDSRLTYSCQGKYLRKTQ